MRFVDTSFWVALRFARDGNHQAAARFWREGPGPLVTSDAVVGETWTFLRRRVDHRRAVQFLDAATRLEILTIRHVDEEIAAEAWRWLRRRDERAYSFVDATSFALMRRLRIREVLAFDDDFAVAGFAAAVPRERS